MTLKLQLSLRGTLQDEARGKVDQLDTGQKRQSLCINRDAALESVMQKSRQEAEHQIPHYCGQNKVSALLTVHP